MRRTILVGLRLIVVLAMGAVLSSCVWFLSFFNTLEILVVRNKAVVPGMTGGSTTGVRRLLEIVNRDEYTLGELDSLLRAGQLDVRQGLPVWGREVTGRIERVWGSRWTRFAQIIAVGGGAVLLQDILAQYFHGKLYLPDDPVMAVARGLYKLAQFQANRKRK